MRPAHQPPGVPWFLITSSQRVPSLCAV